MSLMLSVTELKYKLKLYGRNVKGIFVIKGNLTEEDRKYLEWCLNNKDKVKWQQSKQ